MANITRIKAKDSDEPAQPRASKPAARPSSKASNSKELAVKKSATEVKAPAAATSKAGLTSKTKTKTAKSNAKRPFILFRPFIALGRYLADSWKELRQVRWPNRSTTWKMVAMVIVYTLIFVVLLVVLDVLYEFVFSKILA